MKWNFAKTQLLLGASVMLFSAVNAAQKETNEMFSLPPSVPDPSRAPCFLYNSPERSCSQNSLFITADYIYWKAREEGIYFAVSSQDKEGLPGIPAFFGPDFPIFFPIHGSKMHSFEQDWGAGFKVEAGYNLPWDGWDVSLDYTRYHNAERKSTSVGDNPDKQIYTTWVYTSSILSFASSAAGQWTLHVDEIDLDIGYPFWIGKSVSLRPFAGLKTGWIRQHFDIHYTDLTDYIGDRTEGNCTVKLKNDFWGLGGRGGVSSSWWLSNQWSIFGDVAAALLWGNFHVKNGGKTPAGFVDHLEGGSAPTVDIEDKYRSAKPVWEFAIGLRWETDSSCKRYHFALDASWEQQIWFHQNQLENFPLADITYKESGNLGLSGLTVGARFDF